jgi:hypothetical protein
MVFADCYKRYAHKVNNDAWFMALYKRMLATHWIKLAEKGQRRCLLPIIEEQPDDSLALLVADPQAEDNVAGAAEIAVAWSRASSEAKAVLRIIADAPAEVLQELLNNRISDTRRNRRFRRWANLPGKPDILGELRALLHA